jgi:hypothetical protein
MHRAKTIPAVRDTGAIEHIVVDNDDMATYDGLTTKAWSMSK